MTARLPALALASLLALAACTPKMATRPDLDRVSVAPFGTTPDSHNAQVYTLTNARGMTVRVTDFGGIILSIKTPDRDGRLEEVTLGFDAIEPYTGASPYFGALIGRTGNRIAKGHFTLDGQTYTLAVNNPPNALHGGLRGFDKVLWSAEPFETATTSGLVLTRTSPDGEEGYPGALTVRATYTLADDNSLAFDYHATTTAATPVNLTQHTYFNLSGTAASPGPVRDILAHRLTIDADAVTPVDSTLIPTGALMPVAGTPFDFRQPHAIGERIGQANEQLRFGGGYDHNWVLDRRGRAGLVHAARLEDPESGRTVDIATTEPGLQFYSGNVLDGTLTGHGGAVFAYRTGVALETQHFPDSPNQPAFPSTILRPGETYTSKTVYTFSAR